MNRCRSSDTLTGLVVDRKSPQYPEARLDYNTGIPPAFPLYIVFCQDVHDIQNAIRWSRRFGKPLRARSGRHSYEGYSLVNDGVVIDVSPLNQVHYDSGTGLVKIGAGAALLPIYQALWGHRVTIPGGSCPTVGIAGLTLGGGFGLVSRLFGLTCDALDSLEIVLADGSIVRASAHEHPDLFWASCGGGGGNFGIVSSFTFRTFPINKVTTFVITWPWTDLRPVMKAFQLWADPLTLDARVVPLLKFTSRVVGQVAVVGEFVGPPDELRTILAPLIQAVEPKKVSLNSMDYIDAVYFFAGVKPPTATEEVEALPRLLLPHPFGAGDHEMFKNTSAYQFKPFPDAAIDTMIHWLSHTPGASDLVQFDGYGGAVSARSNHETAFPHRRGVLASLQYQAYWTDARQGPDHIRWVEGFRRAMLPWASDGYVNYIDRDVRNWPMAYYDENLRRLLRVKRRYDPDNVFDFPQGLGRLLQSGRFNA